MNAIALGSNQTGAAKSWRVLGGAGVSGSDQSLTTLLDAIYGRNEPGASERLYELTHNRLVDTARRRLRRDYPRLKAWVETDDLIQDFQIRFLGALEAAKPVSTSHYYALANRTLRNVLNDMIRKIYGRWKYGQNEVSLPIMTDGSGLPVDREPADSSTFDSQKIEKWTEFHEAVAELPDDEWCVFYLWWYEDRKVSEIAEALGIGPQVVRHRLNMAIVILADQLEDLLPNLEGNL